jgi:hypothetical protein
LLHFNGCCADTVQGEQPINITIAVGGFAFIFYYLIRARALLTVLSWTRPGR